MIKTKLNNLLPENFFLRETLNCMSLKENKHRSYLLLRTDESLKVKSFLNQSLKALLPSTDESLKAKPPLTPNSYASTSALLKTINDS